MAVVVTHLTTIIVAFLLILVVAAAVAWRLAGSLATKGWSAGPTINGHDYSGAVADPVTCAFTFPTSAPGVHYVTKPCGSLTGAKGIRMRFRIDADDGVQFLADENGQLIPSGPVLYFQRQGDDWSAKGQFEAYRWWLTSHVPLIEPGVEVEIVGLFTDRWTAVLTSNSDDNVEAFRAALANASCFGFTWEGSGGYGHGMHASGHATFTLLEYALI